MPSTSPDRATDFAFEMTRDLFLHDLGLPSQSFYGTPGPWVHQYAFSASFMEGSRGWLRSGPQPLITVILHAIQIRKILGAGLRVLDALEGAEDNLDRIASAVDGNYEDGLRTGLADLLQLVVPVGTIRPAHWVPKGVHDLAYATALVSLPNPEATVAALIPRGAECDFVHRCGFQPLEDNVWAFGLDLRANGTALREIVEGWTDLALDWP